MFRIGSDRGKGRGSRPVELGIRRVIQTGDSDLHRTVDRVLPAIAIGLDQCVVLLHELVQNPLDVRTAGHDRVSVRGDPQGGRTDVEKQVLRSAPDVVSTLEGEAKDGRRVHHATEGRRQSGRSRDDVVDQLRRLVREVVGERVVVGRVDSSRPEGSVGFHRPHLEPGVRGERIPDRLGPTALGEEVDEEPSARTRWAEQFRTRDAGPALTAQIVVRLDAKHGLHQKRAAEPDEETVDRGITTIEATRDVPLLVVVPHDRHELEDPVAHRAPGPSADRSLAFRADARSVTIDREHTPDR